MRFYDKIAPIYAVLNRLSMPPKKTLQEEVLKEKAGRLLDVGCGDGRDLLLFSKHDCWGIDTSFNMLKTALKDVKQDRLIHVDSNKWPFSDSSFDYITVSHVLSVLTEQDLKVVLNEIARVLKPGGLLWIQNHDSPGWRVFDTCLMPFSKLLHVQLPFYLERTVSELEWEWVKSQKIGRFSYFKLITLRKR